MIPSTIGAIVLRNPRKIEAQKRGKRDLPPHLLLAWLPPNQEFIFTGQQIIDLSPEYQRTAITLEILEAKLQLEVAGKQRDVQDSIRLSLISKDAIFDLPTSIQAFWHPEGYSSYLRQGQLSPIHDILLRPTPTIIPGSIAATLFIEDPENLVAQILNAQNN